LLRDSNVDGKIKKVMEKQRRSKGKDWRKKVILCSLEIRGGV
jgi:hypothetical protein